MQKMTSIKSNASLLAIKSLLVIATLANAARSNGDNGLNSSKNQAAADGQLDFAQQMENYKSASAKEDVLVEYKCSAVVCDPKRIDQSKLDNTQKAFVSKFCTGQLKMLYQPVRYNQAKDYVDNVNMRLNWINFGLILSNEGYIYYHKMDNKLKYADGNSLGSSMEPDMFAERFQGDMLAFLPKLKNSQPCSNKKNVYIKFGRRDFGVAYCIKVEATLDAIAVSSVSSRPLAMLQKMGKFDRAGVPKSDSNSGETCLAAVSPYNVSTPNKYTPASIKQAPQKNSVVSKETAFINNSKAQSLVSGEQDAMTSIVNQSGKSINSSHRSEPQTSFKSINQQQRSVAQSIKSFQTGSTESITGQTSLKVSNQQAPLKSSLQAGNMGDEKGSSLTSSIAGMSSLQQNPSDMDQQGGTPQDQDDISGGERSIMGGSDSGNDLEAGPDNSSIADTDDMGFDRRLLLI